MHILLEDLNFCLVSYMPNYSIKVLVTDFKADPCSNPEDAKFIDSIIADNSLFSISFGDTFHRENVDSTLDLCLVDSNDKIFECWKSDVPFSDGHDIITATVKCSLTQL